MRANPHLLLTLPAIFRAAHWIVARAVVPHVTPVGMACWRWVAALAILAPFAWPHVLRDWDAIRGGWKPIVFFGTCGTVLYNSIGYMGIARTTATNALLLQSVTPGVIPMVAWLLFRERIRGRTALGLAVSFCGVLAIVSRLDAAVLAGLEFAPGDLWLLVNIFLWALYTACLRWQPRNLHPLSFMLAVMAAGLVTGLPAYALDVAAGGVVEAKPGVVTGIFYLAAFPSVLCYIMWNKGVAGVGAAKADAYLHLIPLAGSIVAIEFLDERLHVYHVAGIALIFAGVFLASRGGR